MREMLNGILLPIPASADHTDKNGYAISVVSGEAKIVSSAGEQAVALGVIYQGESVGGDSSIAPFGSGQVVPVQLKSDSAAVVAGNYGILNTDGTFTKDPGTGSRVRAVRFTEDISPGERGGALLLDLQSLS
jgi:hypothetical protein